MDQEATGHRVIFPSLKSMVSVSLNTVSHCQLSDRKGIQ